MDNGTIDDRSSCLVGNPAIFFLEMYAANRLWNIALYVDTIFHILIVITIRNNTVPKNASIIRYILDLLSCRCILRNHLQAIKLY